LPGVVSQLACGLTHPPAFSSLLLLHFSFTSHRLLSLELTHTLSHRQTPLRHYSSVNTPLLRQPSSVHHSPRRRLVLHVLEDAQFLRQFKNRGYSFDFLSRRHHIHLLKTASTFSKAPSRLGRRLACAASRVLTPPASSSSCKQPRRIRRGYAQRLRHPSRPPAAAGRTKAEPADTALSSQPSYPQPLCGVPYAGCSSASSLSQPLQQPQLLKRRRPQHCRRNPRILTSLKTPVRL